MRKKQTETGIDRNMKALQHSKKEYIGLNLLRLNKELFQIVFKTNISVLFTF